jgi:hypothetical protein
MPPPTIPLKLFWLVSVACVQLPAQRGVDETPERPPGGGGYRNTVLPLGGDHERRRREGAGGLGSYKTTYTERQQPRLLSC